MADDDDLSWLDKRFRSHVIQSDGTSFEKRRALNFLGVTVTDDPTNDATKVEFEGGAGIGSGVCTLEQFGAVGDGVTSDQASWVAAIAALAAGTYDTLSLGARTYLIQGGVTLPSGCSIIGQGWSASRLKSTTDQTMIQLSASEDVVLRDFGITMNDQASQVGIALGTASISTGQARVLIANIDFLDCYRAIYGQQNNGGASGPQIVGCRARSCAYAYWFDSGCEFITLTNCKAYQCNRGLHVGAGNIVFVGGELNYNVVAVYLATGTNDAHGIVASSNLNHNTTTIYAAAITNGHSFEGCHMYQGDITVVAGVGITIRGGIVDYGTLSVTGGGAVRFIGVTFDSDYYVATTVDSSSSAQFDVGCRHVDGSVPAFIQSLAWKIPRKLVENTSQSTTRDALDISPDRVTTLDTATTTLHQIDISGLAVGFVGTLRGVVLASHSTGSYRGVFPIDAAISKTGGGFSIDAGGTPTPTYRSASGLVVTVDLDTTPGAEKLRVRCTGPGFGATVRWDGHLYFARTI